MKQPDKRLREQVVEILLIYAKIAIKLSLVDSYLIKQGKLCEATSESTDKIIALLPQATEEVKVYQCPRCATSMEVDPSAKPSEALKEWPKKKDICGKDACGHETCIENYRYNQGLEDSLAVHQSVVKELEEENHQLRVADIDRREKIVQERDRYKKGLEDAKYHLGTALGKGKEMSTTYRIICQALKEDV